METSKPHARRSNPELWKCSGNSPGTTRSVQDAVHGRGSRAEGAQASSDPSQRGDRQAARVEESCTASAGGAPQLQGQEL